MYSRLVYAIFASPFLLPCGNTSAEASWPKNLFATALVATIRTQPENLTGKPGGQSSRAMPKKKLNSTSALIIQTTTMSPSSSRGGVLDMSGQLSGTNTSYLEQSQSLNFAAPAEWIVELPAPQPTAETAAAAAPPRLPEAVKPILFIWALLLCWR
jgi:hypothetical protein